MMALARCTCPRPFSKACRIWPTSRDPPSSRSKAFPRIKPILFRGLVSSWATPLANSPILANFCRLHQLFLFLSEIASPFL